MDMFKYTLSGCWHRLSLSFAWQSPLLFCNHVCKRPRLLFWVAVNVVTLCPRQQKLIVTKNAVLSSLLCVFSVWWDIERPDAVLCAAFEMCFAVKFYCCMQIYAHCTFMCTVHFITGKKKEIKSLFFMCHFTRLSLGGSIALQVDWLLALNPSASFLSTPELRDCTCWRFSVAYMTKQPSVSFDSRRETLWHSLTNTCISGVLFMRKLTQLTLNCVNVQYKIEL